LVADLKDEETRLGEEIDRLNKEIERLMNELDAAQKGEREKGDHNLKEL
jgi:prefoldin subunit 5